MFSSDGTLSDIITVSNTGPGGTGKITFSSDPNLSTPPPNALTLCTEVLDQGCVGSITLTGTDGSTFTVKPASDDEANFDPFGFIFDSSVQIQFNGATPINTPEPSSMLLLGTGLISFAGMIRRRLIR
jgi:hypothetical protein